MDAIDQLKYNFSFEVEDRPNESRALVYKNFKIKNNRSNHFYDAPIELLAPSNEVLFKVLMSVGDKKLSKFSIESESHFAYVHCQNSGAPTETPLDILCVDRISIKISMGHEQKCAEQSDPYLGKTVVAPARYEFNGGVELNIAGSGGRSRVFLGDFYNKIIQKHQGDPNDGNPLEFKEQDLQPKACQRSWWHEAGLACAKYTISRNSSEAANGEKPQKPRGKNKNSKPITFVVEGSFTLGRYPLAEVALFLPFPPVPDVEEFKPPEHAVAVASLHLNEDKTAGEFHLSKDVRSNLETLSSQLGFLSNQITWIKGDPGSGKEGFSHALHYGSVSTLGHGIETRSAAGSGYEELNQRLFSSNGDEPCLIEQAEYMNEKGKKYDYESILNQKFPDEEERRFKESKIDNLPEWRRAFAIDDVEKRYGGTIFLDEFDKVDETEAKKIYGNMLRVLEAKEYIKRLEFAGTGDAEPFAAKEVPQRYKELNWIFAGAFSQVDPSEIVPPDFWSRLTGYIAIRNPLSNDRGYARSLFCLFYVQEALKILDPVKGEQQRAFSKLLNKTCDEMDMKEWIFASVLGFSREDLENGTADGRRNAPFKHPQKLLAAADDFARMVVINPGIVSPKIDSARAIRQAALIVCHEMRAAIIASAHEIAPGDNRNFEANMAKAIELAQRSLLLSRGI